ncbi:hypothetical protein [Azohydromonas caseinilytica]|uniref:Uncharacterized protein n=1 Tax=Azohydromonas caseinilytica TaxID=2728836 RepID=A0A848FJV0_9BURK|nr:hypothetical protein [Azohydromonas caseinilytica]NML19165.1 hypothetical protein [Azohydromonas caseinilytica]
MDDPFNGVPSQEALPRPVAQSKINLGKTETLLLSAQPQHKVRKTKGAVALQQSGGIAEAASPAWLDPRPIPWLVLCTAVPLLAGYLALMARLVLGMTAGWPELSLLGLHTAGCIAVLAAYFGKSIALTGLKTKTKDHT